MAGSSLPGASPSRPSRHPDTQWAPPRSLTTHTLTRSYRALTVGGLGLKAIRGPEQVEAFIASVKRIRALTEQATGPIELHLTTHGFSTGLAEAKELLKTRQPRRSASARGPIRFPATTG